MKQLVLCAIIAALAFPVVVSAAHKVSIVEALRHDWTFVLSFSATVGADSCFAYLIAAKLVGRMPSVLSEAVAFAVALRVMLSTIVVAVLFYNECYLAAFALYHWAINWHAIGTSYAAYFAWPVMVTTCATTAFVSYIAPEPPIDPHHR